MIEFRDVWKHYHLNNIQIPVLKNINFKIAQGELVAFMGPSGSGKSTIMNILGFLDQPSKGQYDYYQQCASDLTSDKLAKLRNRDVGFIFQSFMLLPRFSVLQNVCLPLSYRGDHPRSFNEKAIKKLEKVGLQHLAHHKPNELSGGQQQRVAIARALVTEPKLILADEPTGALDINTGQEIMNLLIDLNKHENTTIILVTHDMKIAKQCHRVITLQDGNIL
jgi:putative ABC transport system ATP-binding protein